MQLELDCRLVMFADGLDPTQGLRRCECGQAAAALQHAPVILVEGRQQRVTESESRLSEIAADEIDLLWIQGGVSQQFFYQQQAGTTIEQQASSFGVGD